MSSFQHKRLVPLVAGALAVITGLAGCAGNGDGLNSKGLPIGSSSSGGGGGTGSTGPFTADFQSIQDNVFTPICSPCHSGASAPEGLMLDAAHSYNLLVGVPSTEVPTLDRVKPGDPVNSYIIIKLTNGAGIVGQQMPLGENPLPQATIDVIRQWITNGAPPATAAATSSVNAMAKIQALAQNTPSAPFSVTQTSPLDAAQMETPVNHIVVAFNHEVDASLVNYTTLTVERVDTGGAVESATGATQATPLPAYAALAEGNPSAIVITPVAPLLPGTYRVTVRGSGGGALADLNAQVLGSDYSFTFNGEASP
jgi:methionine-rich copper-binding protein CopC